MNGNFTLTKDLTRIVKGVAILLMLFHHFFAFPQWYVEGISYIGIPLRYNTFEYIVGKFGHICVSIFAFLTGFGMFYSYKSGSIIKKSFKKGVSFLICYWLVLFGVSIPLNLAFGYRDITWKMILENMFSYDNSLVPFAWYVRFYIVLLVTLPLFYKAMTKYAVLTILMFLLIPTGINFCLGKVPGINGFVIKGVYFTMEHFFWLPCALVGLCCAKYLVFEKVGRVFSKLKKFEFLVCLALLAVIFYLRAYKESSYGMIFNYDCIYAPVFVFLICRVLLAFPKFIKSVLSVLGDNSMNIWFLHSLVFFRLSFLMKYAYAPKISILIVVWVAFVCLILSLGLSKVSGMVLGKNLEIFIRKCYNRLKIKV